MNIRERLYRIKIHMTRDIKYMNRHIKLYLLFFRGIDSSALASVQLVWRFVTVEGQDKYRELRRCIPSM